MAIRTQSFARALLGIAVALMYCQSAPAEPGLALQGPDYYSFMVGDVKVTALSDGSVPLDVHKLLRNISKEKIDELLARNFQSCPVEASINSFLFRVGDRLVLVDTGSGELFGPALGDKLLPSLESAGVKADAITDVLLTHAHSDHMGVLLHAGKLTFPNATVHVAKADLDFFMDPENAKRTGYGIHYFEQAAKVLGPCQKAGKIKPFSDKEEVVPGVAVAVHPGHTPGTTFYTLTSKGQQLVFIGDTIHVGAVQAAAPEVTIAFDVDPAKAAAVRREAFTAFAEHKTLVAIPHMSFPGVGYFRQAGDGFEWVPIIYTNRDPAAKLPPAEK